jgi:hypothetical protein
MSGAVFVDSKNINSAQNNFKAASMGFDYKISEKCSIGIKAVVSQGNSNYIINPRTGRYDYNPNNSNSTGLFLSPLTQWGMENNLNPTIK